MYTRSFKPLSMICFYYFSIPLLLPAQALSLENSCSFIYLNLIIYSTWGRLRPNYSSYPFTRSLVTHNVLLCNPRNQILDAWNSNLNPNVISSCHPSLRKTHVQTRLKKKLGMQHIHANCAFVLPLQVKFHHVMLFLIDLFLITLLTHCLSVLHLPTPKFPLTTIVVMGICKLQALNITLNQTLLPGHIIKQFALIINQKFERCKKSFNVELSNLMMPFDQ